MSKALMPTTAEDKAAMIEPFPADKCPMGYQIYNFKT